MQVPFKTPQAKILWVVLNSKLSRDFFPGILASQRPIYLFIVVIRGGRL